MTSATPRSVLNVVRLLGLPEDEFATVEDQVAGRDFLDDSLRNWISERPTENCLEQLDKAEVVASRIFSAEDICSDPIYEERGDIITVDDPDLGLVRMQGVVPRFQQRPGQVWRTGPKLGQDNDLVYSEWLGIPADELHALRESEVI